MFLFLATAAAVAVAAAAVAVAVAVWCASSVEYILYFFVSAHHYHDCVSFVV